MHKVNEDINKQRDAEYDLKAKYWQEGFDDCKKMLSQAIRNKCCCQSCANQILEAMNMKGEWIIGKIEGNNLRRGDEMND
jgi:hypothetical protein